ncbi:hypothetical protein BC629DRAFT_810634 [Irpex lacteus]|nr:hypothetical protein BC629DRAFT_810634 [Irpex lacteus]
MAPLFLSTTTPGGSQGTPAEHKITHCASSDDGSESHDLVTLGPCADKVSPKLSADKLQDGVPSQLDMASPGFCKRLNWSSRSLGGAKRTRKCRSHALTQFIDGTVDSPEYEGTFVSRRNVQSSCTGSQLLIVSEGDDPMLCFSCELRPQHKRYTLRLSQPNSTGIQVMTFVRSSASSCGQRRALRTQNSVLRSQIAGPR